MQGSWIAKRPSGSGRADVTCQALHIWYDAAEQIIMKTLVFYTFTQSGIICAFQYKMPLDF